MPPRRSTCAACADNLRRLRLERLELVHVRYTEGSGVPLADSLATMAALRAEGKIRHIGVSNVPLAQLDEAQEIIPIASVQNLYSVSSRDGEDVLDACTARAIPFMPYVVHS
ncbi:MAG: aldo/keto reductase [Chloroflexi bacterium]|nr:aldo/keto reductase [Chloroflexota bacterium]